MKILWLYINSHYSAFIPVSVSLCEMPTPSQELIDKYNDLKSVFTSRLMNILNKVQDAASPVVQSLSEGEDAKLIKGYIDSLANMPQMQIASKLSM